LDIPVMHDDQHGTAVVVLAGLLNAAKVVGKNFKDMKIAISGAGAAGVAVAKLLYAAGNKHVIVFDTKGAIYKGRQNLTAVKFELASFTNPPNYRGSLEELSGADAFVGVSGPNTIDASFVKRMAKNPIVFALANPAPEIMPEEAKKGGAKVIATGRSDFPNQINNSLAFPGIFRGALDHKVTKITDEMKLKAAKAIAALVKKPTANKIVPDMFDKKVAKAVAKVIR
jgi:malate dehydrogenase (oxaloacetate-decarboxylating)